jgi:hypothetical protein
MVFQLNCYPCSVGDSAQDTVKFDASLMAEHDKENVQTNAVAAPCNQKRPREDASTAENDTAQALLTEQEAKLAADQMAADVARRQEEERAAKRHEAERLQLEAARQEKEEADARAAAQAAEQHRQEQLREAAETAERLRQEELRQAAEVERLRQEKEQEEHLAAQRQAAIDKAHAYLTQNRFTDVNALRKSTWKAKRPLHSAVKANDVEIVRCLLLAGADPTLTNSAGQTPCQVAQSLNKNASHAAVLAALPGPASS